MEPPYECEEHRSLGRLLHYCGIPFLYQQSAAVRVTSAHEKQRQIFILPSYGGMVVEYVPDARDMADLEELWHREKAYREDWIKAVFVYRHDLDEPGRALVKIAEAYRAGGPTKYRAT